MTSVYSGLDEAVQNCLILTCTDCFIAQDVVSMEGLIGITLPQQVVSINVDRLMKECFPNDLELMPAVQIHDSSPHAPDLLHRVRDAICLACAELLHMMTKLQVEATIRILLRDNSALMLSFTETIHFQNEEVADELQQPSDPRVQISLDNDIIQSKNTGHERTATIDASGPKFSASEENTSLPCKEEFASTRDGTCVTAAEGPADKEADVVTRLVLKPSNNGRGSEHVCQRCHRAFTCGSALLMHEFSKHAGDGMVAERKIVRKQFSGQGAVLETNTVVPPVGEIRNLKKDGKINDQKKKNFRVVRGGKGLLGQVIPIKGYGVKIDESPLRDRGEGWAEDDRVTVEWMERHLEGRDCGESQIQGEDSQMMKELQDGHQSFAGQTEYGDFAACQNLTGPEVPPSSFKVYGNDPERLQEEHVRAHDVKMEIETAVETEEETFEQQRVLQVIEKRLMCPHSHCDKSFTQAKQLRRHLFHTHNAMEEDIMQLFAEMEEDTAGFYCKACSEAFLSHKSLLHHLEFSHDFVEPLKQQVKSALGLVNKPGPVDSPQDAPTPNLPCPYCLMMLPDAKALVLHKLRDHRDMFDGSQGDDSVYECHLCDQIFPDKNQLYAHIKFHSHSIKQEVFPCLECPKLFKNPKDLSMHQKCHRGSFPLICSRCGQGFVTKIALDKHELKHDPEQLEKVKVRCEQCESTYTDQKALDQHIAKNHSSLTYSWTCPECGKKLKTETVLKWHLKHSHGELKGPFPCTVCGRTYRSRHGLKAHSETHTGLARYTCNVCGRTFNFKSSFEGHMNLHMGHLPYKCRTCDKSFAFRQSWRKHEAGHVQKWVACPTCNSQFSNYSRLMTHRNKVHKYKRSDMEAGWGTKAP